MRIKIRFIYPATSRRHRRRILDVAPARDAMPDLKLSDLQKIIDVEAFLEELTGLRVHILEDRP